MARTTERKIITLEITDANIQVRMIYAEKNYAEKCE